MLVLAYRHIKWGLVLKLLKGAFSWHPWIPGTLKLDSILSLFKCAIVHFSKSNHSNSRFWTVKKSRRNCKELYRQKLSVAVDSSAAVYICLSIITARAGCYLMCQSKLGRCIISCFLILLYMNSIDQILISVCYL